MKAQKNSSIIGQALPGLSHVLLIIILRGRYFHYTHEEMEVRKDTQCTKATCLVHGRFGTWI